jgi:hypothetical protein
MGTVLTFTASSSEPRRTRNSAENCEIVIFPGVRIERHDNVDDLDLGYRMNDFGGGSDFDGLGGGNRPRKTS